MNYRITPSAAMLSPLMISPLGRKIGYRFNQAERRRHAVGQSPALTIPHGAVAKAPRSKGT